MSKEIPFDQDKKAPMLEIEYISTNMASKFIMPLHVEWKPKEDISTYELAMCLPYLLRLTLVMPYEVNKDEPHMRHFEILDPN
jgi:hypothetical protein